MENLIICAPVTNPTHALIPDSEAVACADCGRAIWLAPSSRAYITEQEAHTFQLVCGACADARISANPAITLAHHLTAAQQAELLMYAPQELLPKLFPSPSPGDAESPK